MQATAEPLALLQQLRPYTVHDEGFAAFAAELGVRQASTTSPSQSAAAACAPAAATPTPPPAAAAATPALPASDQPAPPELLAGVVRRVVALGQSVEMRHEAAPENFKVYLAFARDRRELRVIESQVPGAVLPYKAEIFDVRVKSRYDDDVYARKAEIWRRVARGNWMVHLRPDDGQDVWAFFQSLRKFGGATDEDDDVVDEAERRGPDVPPPGSRPPPQQTFFLADPAAHATEIVAMAKANGEAAHLSVMWVKGSFLMFTGSKNVHMVTRVLSDIDYYETHDRFSVAVIVTRAVYALLASLMPDQKQQLLGFLAATGLTATFEMLQPNYLHVETPRSDRLSLQFIGFVRADPDGPGSSLLGVHPAVGLEIAAYLGMTTVSYCRVPYSRLPDVLEGARRLHGREGLVLYYVDAEGRTIGLEKRKSVWYVVLRACREKLRSALTAFAKIDVSHWPQRIAAAAAECQAKMRTRLKEIVKFMPMSPLALAKWEELLLTFIHWSFYALADTFMLNIYIPPECEGLQPRMSVSRVSTEFPRVYQQFLQYANREDLIDIEEGLVKLLKIEGL